MNNTDIRIREVVSRYKQSGIEEQIDFEKFYLYSIVTHSTAIEGSTITEVENQLLFDEGILPAGRTVVEQLMNLDLKEAYVKWLGRAKSINRFTTETLCEMAADVMRRTGTKYSTALGEFDASKGELRLLNVRAGVSGRSYMSFQKVPTRVEEFCQWLNSRLRTIDTLDVATAYRLSFAAHYRLVTIHPWADGNGRTTRLLMNVLQARCGLPMSKITQTEKSEYIQALIDSREQEDENVFIDKAMTMLADDLEKQLRLFDADTNVTDNADNVTGNVTETQHKILELLEQRPDISQSELAQLVGIHRVNINRNMQQLVRLGLITRVGSDRKGYWKITKQ